MEEERKRFDRVAWGAGRIAFNSHLPFIQKQIDAGWPMTAVYKQIKDSLAGMSYNLFTYHARKHFTSTSGQCRKKREAFKGFAESADRVSHIEPLVERGSANDEKPQTPEQHPTIARKNESPTSKFRSTSAFRGFVPGPKVPDLNELF